MRCPGGSVTASPRRSRRRSPWHWRSRTDRTGRTKKNRGRRRGFFTAERVLGDDLNLRRLRAFRAFLGDVRHLLAFGQRLEAAGLNFREVREQVLGAIF